MQGHGTAAARALLIVCAFGATAVPGTAQTATGIEREVRESLRDERDLRQLDVTVTGSEVTLTGEVDTFWAKSEAIRLALQVDGVDTVASEIVIATNESDDVLAGDVARVVQRYSHYTLFDLIEGDINQGVVTLTGKVTSEREKARELFELVAKVRGVQDVQMEIVTLTPSSEDDSLRLAIARQIFRSSHFEQFAGQPNPPFHIIVDKSVVTLVGWVQSDIERIAMEQIARGTRGVLRVVNQLQTMS